MSDKIRQFNKGEFTIRSKDVTSGSLVITAKVSPSGSASSDSLSFKRVSGTSVRLFEVSPLGGGLSSHPRFYSVKDTEILDPILSVSPQGTSLTTIEPLREYLTVTLIV